MKVLDFRAVTESLLVGLGERLCGCFALLNHNLCESWISSKGSLASFSYTLFTPKPYRTTQTDGYWDAEGDNGRYMCPSFDSDSIGNLNQYTSQAEDENYRSKILGLVV